jgi:phospholipid/cholesterol/gamma-HCH transport system substrate-binding protein
MITSAQSIRVGLFAAITLGLLALVLAVFGGLRFWETTDRYRIVFDTSVMGLEPGAQVYLNGIRVGTVADLDVAPDDIRKVAVAIEIKHGAPVHADTRAILSSAGLTGLKVIDLRDGTSAAPTLPPGSQIAAGTGLLDKLEAQAQTIMDQSTALMKRATALTDNLIALADHLDRVSDPARRAADNLAAMTASLKAMVDENRAALRDSLAAVKQTATGASELLDGQVAQLLGNAGDVIGELRKLVTSNEAPLRAAVFDLRQASRNFKELTRDVRQRPSRLLFSSDPSERKLP